MELNIIFTSQPNLVIESDVHQSLHQNFHHQIIYVKFKLQFYYLTLTAKKRSTINMQILI